MVIGRARLFILQHVVGFGNFFELLLSVRVARVFVRVPFHGELAVSFFQLVGSGGAINSKKGIKIWFGQGERSFRRTLSKAGPATLSKGPACARKVLGRVFFVFVDFFKVGVNHVIPVGFC